MNRPILLTQNNSKSCRICLDTDNQNDLISPCLCTGGSAYVHRKCLDNWRSLNKNGRAFKFCEVCQFEYIIEPVIDDPSADKKRLLIFRLLVSRDITLIILLLQAIIIGMTFLIQAADKKKNEIKHLYPAWMSPFGVYYLSSLILFFAMLGLFGLIAFCCGMANNRDVHRSDYACYGCLCVGSDCNGCDGNGSCNGNDGGGGGAAILIIILLMFAILGIFVGIILSVTIIREIIKHHTNKLWLRQETKKYVVKDFQGRRNELENISSPRRNNNSFINKNPFVNKNKITPSAPVEELSVIT
jgi:hypothetical protein